MKRRRWRWIAVGVCCVVAVLLVAAYQIYPYRGTWPDRGRPLPLETRLTRAQVQADVDFAFASLRDRHMATVHGVPPALAERYAEVRDAVPEEPTVLDAWRSVARLANVMGDAHTMVHGPVGRVTVASFRFDGTSLRLVEPGASETPEVLALNGVPVADLWDAYQRLASYERLDAARATFARTIGRTSLLRLLGAPASDHVVAALPAGPRELPTREVGRGGEPRPPEVRFEGDTAVLRLDECRPGPAYTAALDELFAGIRSRGIERLVVDLRANGGGDSTAADEFIGRLDVADYRSGGSLQRWGPFVLGSGEGERTPNHRVAEPYRGRVWVLTSSQTFSSAVMFTWLLQDNDLATVVGQSPANNPNSYGDIIELRLPESGLTWTTTYKLFTRANGDTDPAKPLVPDVVTEPGGELAAVEKDR